MHKTTGEVWDPWRLVILLLITRFCMHKTAAEVLGPIETCNSDPKVAVLHVKSTDEGRDPERLAILLLITLFCMHKMTGELWDP